MTLLPPTASDCDRYAGLEQPPKPGAAGHEAHQGEARRRCPDVRV